MSKGSRRRPCQIGAAEWCRRWHVAFGQSDGVRQFDRDAARRKQAMIRLAARSEQ